MTVLDIVKIVVPIILSLCGAVFVVARWSLDKQAASAQKMWEAINSSLLKNIDQVDANLASHKRDYHQRINKVESRIHSVEGDLHSHKKEVAEFYIKRQDWLEHAVALERKVDELRRDVHMELQGITKLLSNISKTRDD